MNNPIIPDAVRRLAGITAPMDYVSPQAFEFVSDKPLAAAPDVMRVQSLERLLTDGGKILNRATLFHERGCFRVAWVSKQADSRIHRFSLVTIRRAHGVREADGYLRIDRLLPADRPRADVNLFATVLPEWVADRDIVQRASALWEELPRPFAHLVNAVFWESHRFHCFVMGPSSINGHHNGWNGNFRHSVEVAEHGREIARRTDLASVPVVIAAGMLHDAAKAVEYRYDRYRGEFRLSDRGELVGHRDTLIEWMAVARETDKVIVADGQYLALLHAINAVRGAPSWLGMREPRSLEAEIVTMADRLSGREDLYERCAPEDERGGFGAYHKHLGHRAFVTRDVCLDGP
jgi:3'-5' exoribonuclease